MNAPVRMNGGGLNINRMNARKRSDDIRANPGKSPHEDFLSTQPVDNSGEKFGATGGQPGKHGGEREKNRRNPRRHAHQVNAAAIGSHITCGCASCPWPAVMPVVPVFHRTYYYDGFYFSAKHHNQQWVHADGCLAARGAVSECPVLPAHQRHRHGIISASASTYPQPTVSTPGQRTGGGSP
jgi:hypothetical protein